MESDLAQTIDHYYENVAAVLAGNPEPQKELWTRRDDATLANPLGPPARGWSEVEQALERAASVIRDGELISHDRVSEYATTDLAYILEIERSRAKFGGADDKTAGESPFATLVRSPRHVPRTRCSSDGSEGGVPPAAAEPFDAVC